MAEEIEKQVRLHLVLDNDERLREDKLSPEERVEEINQITGYRFQNPILLENALTHPSFNREEVECSHSFKKLQYIGNSVLSLMIAKYHYDIYPDLNSGMLTKLRAANVNTEKLARVALKHELYKFLRHDIPSLAGQIKEFISEVEVFPEHLPWLVDAPKVLAIFIESFIGAVYNDCDSMDTTWTIVSKLLEPTISLENLNSHPVTLLFETCQKNGLEVKEIDTWKTTHKIEFVVDGEIVGSAKYDKKKSIAYNRAAFNACNSDVVKKLCLQNV